VLAAARTPKRRAANDVRSDVDLAPLPSTRPLGKRDRLPPNDQRLAWPGEYGAGWGRIERGLVFDFSADDESIAEKRLGVRVAKVIRMIPDSNWGAGRRAT
jgi:hypothetical protein